MNRVSPAATTREPRRGMPGLYAIALVLVFAAGIAVTWGSSAPIGVTLDGVRRTMPPGATVGDLVSKGYALSHPGALISALGVPLRAGGGDPLSVTRNGAAVSDAQRLFDGDILTSRSGANLRERIVTVNVSIVPTTTIVGTGPLLKLVSPGKPGVEEVTKGVVSGSILATRTLVPVANMVLSAGLPSSTDKLVALTFDDGPWAVQTQKILDILKANHVPATFFVLGQQVRRFPELAAAEMAQGHNVGNHTWDHPDLTKLKPAAVRKEITSAADNIRAVTGTAPTWLRPPYGAVDHSVWQQVRGLHEGVVLWDVDSLDWTRPGVPRIVANVTSHMGRASIVLMHDGGGDRSQTIAALPLVIDWLKAHEYTFVTVGQMEAAR